MIWFEILFIMFDTNWACNGPHQSFHVHRRNGSTKSFVWTVGFRGKKKQLKRCQFQAHIVGIDILKLQRWRSNRPLRSMVFTHLECLNHVGFNIKREPMKYRSTKVLKHATLIRQDLWRSSMETLGFHMALTCDTHYWSFGSPHPLIF